MRAIDVGNGQSAKVDDEDYAIVSGIRWHVYAAGYAIGSLAGRLVHMHRLVMSPPKGKVVDHINGDKLDNRRSNLRLCETRENSRNRKSNRCAASRFRGVDEAKKHGKSTQRWRVRICVDGTRKQIGTFATETEAARAFDDAARKLYGAFARLNFPREGEQPAVAA